eukprot:6194676-Pleurochrysis_carterae.AAC.1
MNRRLSLADELYSENYVQMTISAHAPFKIKQESSSSVIFVHLEPTALARTCAGSQSSSPPKIDEARAASLLSSLVHSQRSSPLSRILGRPSATTGRAR